MRRGSSRRLTCLAGTLLAVLVAPAPALADPHGRIINGQRADQGEYTAQGLLEFTRPDGTFVCGGTLLSNRHFVTAAHCATLNNSQTELSPTAFTVTLGNVDSLQGDEFSVADNDVNDQYDASEFDNDVAILTLSTPAPPALEPLRLVAEDETALWQPNAAATIIGWGETESGSLSRFLLEANVPMQSDSFCGSGSAWGSDFHPLTMVCAGGGSTDSCGGDSGGPLMVSDSAFLILAGLTSWGAIDCGTPGLPGVYTRLGTPALNAWVRERVPMAQASVSDSTPQPGESVNFSVSAQHPTNPGFFTNFAWDFESDGTIDNTGATVSHTYPAASTVVARVRATGAGPDVATAKVAVGVTAPPPPAPPPPPPPAPVVTPPVAAPRVNLATILVSGRPRVRGGRFNVRINFNATAPPGIAVIEVFRGKKKIGSAKTRVRRGGSKRVSIKLTRAGRRLLRKSSTKRLKVKVQVRVGRRVLRSKRLTIRR